MRNLFAILGDLVSSKMTKKASMLVSVGIGAFLITQGQSEAGAGVIAAAMSSNTAVK